MARAFGGLVTIFVSNLVSLARQYCSLTVFINKLIDLMRKYRDFINFHINSSRLSEIASHFVCPLIKFYVSVEQYPSLMWFAVKALCFRDFTDHPEFCFCL